MKRIIVYSMILIAVSACSKQSSVSTETMIPVDNKVETVSGSNILPPVDDGKKYGQKICRVGEKFGTICEDPGSSCNKYDCTASSASSNTKQLSVDEINKYAETDANYLLEKGLINKEYFQKAKNFSKLVLLERNKTLSK